MTRKLTPARRQAGPRAGPHSDLPVPAVFTSIDVDVRAAVAIVTLNRPDVHNAFDEALIAELTAALQRLDRDQSGARGGADRRRQELLRRRRSQLDEKDGRVLAPAEPGRREGAGQHAV